MKLKDFGNQVTAVEKELGTIISSMSKNDVISYIKGQLPICMAKNDIVKALAIVDYCIHNTDISSADLSFLTTDDNIYQMSHEKGYDDFEIEFLGFCEALHYIE